MSTSQLGSVSSAGVNMLRSTRQLLALPWISGFPSGPSAYVPRASQEYRLHLPEVFMQLIEGYWKFFCFTFLPGVA